MKFFSRTFGVIFIFGAKNNGEPTRQHKAESERSEACAYAALCFEAGEQERGRGGIKNNFEDLLCVAFSLLLSLGIATVFHFLGSLKGQQQHFAAHTGLFGVC